MQPATFAALPHRWVQLQMPWITDSLSAAFRAVGSLNPFGRQSSAIETLFSHQMAIAAYMSSGMLRKVIAIPAADRTQKWRDWQTDKATIALIEAEEKRLGLRHKVKAAETLRGVGGGALLLITAGDHASELKPDAISKGGLVAINVISRWQITGEDWDRELASPTCGMPRMFRIEGDGTRTRIHPSRVVCFRGDPIPAGGTIPIEEAFWGDCRLLRVFTEVQRSDNAQAWMAELAKKAKLLRVGIPNLSDFTATPDGQAKLNKRVALIAEGESTLNAVVYDAGNGEKGGGETIDDYQMTWTGIPAYLDSFDQRVACVADMPFTRLTGRSPAGMNATGEHDTDNWHDAVTDGQENETRPCLEQIDPLLLRSAGVTKTDTWWVWSPLTIPTEKEEAETFGLLMTAIEKLINSGMVPHEALARAVQNLIEERGYMPGLADALAKIPEDIRFGIEQEPGEGDPSALTEGGDPDLAGAGDYGSVPRRRAANDKVTDAEGA